MSDTTPLAARIARALAEFWAGANGDFAYAAYVRHRRLAHPHGPPPTRADYERLVQERRYGRVSRCC